jgi:hypothetical protein
LIIHLPKSSKIERKDREKRKREREVARESGKERRGSSERPQKTDEKVSESELKKNNPSRDG